VKRLLLAIALFTFAHGSSAFAQGTTIETFQDDPEIIAATAEALKSLDTFLEAFKSDKAAMELPSLQLTYQDEAGNLEMLTVVNFVQSDDDTFTGDVTLPPVVVQGISEGDQISFNRSQITDWSFAQNDQYFGGFTQRVRLSRMSKGMQKILGKKYQGPSLPEGW